MTQALHTCNELGTCILLGLEHKSLGPALVQEDMDPTPKHEGLAPSLGCKRWALQCPSPAGSPGPTPPFTPHLAPPWSMRWSDVQLSSPPSTLQTALALEHEVARPKTEQPACKICCCPHPGAGAVWTASANANPAGALSRPSRPLPTSWAAPGPMPLELGSSSGRPVARRPCRRAVAAEQPAFNIPAACTSSLVIACRRDLAQALHQYRALVCTPQTECQPPLDAICSGAITLLSRPGVKYRTLLAALRVRHDSYARSADATPWPPPTPIP